MILAADDVGDAQIGVVDARGEMVGGIGIGTQQGKVFDIVGGLGHLAIHAIGKPHDAALAARHAISQRKRLAGSGAAIGLFT